MHDEGDQAASCAMTTMQKGQQFPRFLKVYISKDVKELDSSSWHTKPVTPPNGRKQVPAPRTTGIARRFADVFNNVILLSLHYTTVTGHVHFPAWKCVIVALQRSSLRADGTGARTVDPGNTACSWEGTPPGICTPMHLPQSAGLTTTPTGGREIYLEVPRYLGGQETWHESTSTRFVKSLGIRLSALCGREFQCFCWHFSLIASR
jgi:hypothetical protein